MLKNIIYLLAIILLVANCKDDEEPGFTESCCNIPPLTAAADQARIFGPNAFTPNGDGVNDIFRVFTSSEVTEVLNLSIKDEAGNLMFEAKNFLPYDASMGWDGTNPDGQIVEGIYKYDVEIELITGSTFDFSGTVCCRPGTPISCITNEADCAYGIQNNGLGTFDPNANTGESCQ